MTGSLWRDMDAEIQRQLSLQVELSLDRHDAFLGEHGIDDCRSVVDIGTGSGQFLNEIAVRHPAVHFVGIDNKAHMLDAARKHPATTIDWVLADALDGTTARAVASADGILMRYCILHLHDTHSALKKLLHSARPGTRLWVIDLDIDNNICVPSDQAYSDFVDLVRCFCDENQVEIHTGARLPGLLEASGFHTDAVCTEPFNSKQIEPATLVSYLMREACLYHYHLKGTTGTAELAPLRDALESRARDPDGFVQYGMTMLSARRRPIGQ